MDTNAQPNGTQPSPITRALAELDADALPTAAEPFVALVSQYLARTSRRELPVSRPSRESSERAAPVALPRRGRPLSEVVSDLARDVVMEAIHLSHPMYMGHQIGAPLPVAVWTEALVGALNQAMTVTEMSPTATRMERGLIRAFCELAGFGPGAGGMLTSGGTEATFTALLAARARLLPEAWTEGIPARAPVVVCGEYAHYSVSRAVAELGLGTRRVVSIPSRGYRMDPVALQETLSALERAGTAVMTVVAAAGATATGAYDDLEAIADVCDARGLWLHVDGAQGATALLSDMHRHKVRGLERACSVTWDPHKAMLIPIPAGMLLVRDEHDLDTAFAQRAPYIFHEDARYHVPDSGTRSFLCARRADVLKVWAALQRYGTEGMSALYDHQCAVAEALYAQLEASTEFEAFHRPEGTILCFRWVGHGQHAPEELDRLNLALRERYNASGKGWLTQAVLGGRRVLRVTIANPRTTPADTQALLDGLSAVARELLP